jgi:hypothetical protein
MRFRDGEAGALITNLRDITAGEIKGLYRKRWDVEQKYHTLKNKLKFESITGNASIYVEQDLRAQVLVFNLVLDVITGAQLRAQRGRKRRRSRYKTRINENIAIGLYKEHMIRLMLEEDSRKRGKRFARLKEEMLKNVVPIRRSPSKPRKWNYFNKHKCNLKPSF